MRLSRCALAVLALALLGPALLTAQDQPLAAGSEGVPVPKKKKHVQPVYPREALAQGIRGIVILDLVIDTEGRVAETSIIRSIPGLDEAALVAASQWIYAPVKVDGEPVSVRLTVPITFALKLPEMSRQPGIPQLRQGVTPPWPDSGSPAGGKTVADVTLEPDGRIGLARILEGEEPWSTALLQALRTWRFSAPSDDVTVSFQVAAEFMRGRKGDDGAVRLALSGLREAAIFEDPQQPEPMATAQLTPMAEPAAEPVAEPAGEPAARPAGEPDAEPVPEPAGEAATEPQPAAAPPAPPEIDAPPAAAPPAQAAEAVPTTAPVSAAATPPAVAPPAAPAPAPEPDDAPEPAIPAGLALARPAGQQTAPAPAAVPQQAPASPAETTAAAAAAPQGVDPTAPPPIETLSVAPPPLPPENGISAIRGVDLEPGVPDLTRGRRPVSPPLARMAGAAGTVEVDFSVSAGGVTSIQRANGPEVLQPAATAAVESWIFRRTRADRAYLVAVFTYEDDLASAVVRPQQQN